MPLRAAALALVLLLARPLPSMGQAAPPHLMINDIDVTREAAPLMQNGVELLPAPLVAGAFGAATAWDAGTRTMTVTGAAGAIVRLVAGQGRAEVGGTWRDLPAAPVVRDGTLWAPALALLRALGAYIVDGDDAATQFALAQVTGVSWRADGSGLSVRVSATGPVHADAHLLHAPERLVLDLIGAVSRLPAGPQDVGIAGIQRVRGGQFQVRPFITRIVFDLDHPMKFSAASRPGEVALALGDAAPPHAASAAPPPAGVPAVSPGPSPPAAPPVPHGPAASTPAPSAPTPPPAPPSGAPAPGAQAPGAFTHDDHTVAEHAAGAAPAAPPAESSGIAPEPLALPPLPEFEDRPGAFHIEQVAYDDQGSSGRITIRASRRVAFAVHEFVYPDRLAVDITGGIYRARRHDIEVDSDAVRNIVVSQFQLAPNVTRVLVHLNRRLPYGTAVADAGRTLVVTLGNPGRRLARGSAVIIDPGHGGADGGAVGPTGLREADVALAVSRLVRDALAQQGITAVLTRTDDSTVPLEERPDLAVRYGGMLFVSIHANASRSIGPAGTETYYAAPEGLALARVVQSEVVQALGEPDRGVRSADFYVLVNTPMPSVLVETAFITNPAEEAMLRDPAVQRRIADAIARAVAKYLAAERQPGSFAPRGARSDP
jgi:N-acetylmuramoyl-L-alanine amidase